MNNQQILFYIIVPVYKAEAFLEQCVNSVLNQTYSNWELILVDDGSPDRSGEMCDSYAQQNQRIHVIHQPNQGQIAARTAGNRYILNNKVDHSYAVYLDSDDTLELNALERIENHIQHSNADIIVYNWQRVENGRTRKVTKNIFKGLVTDKRELYKIVFSNPFYNSLCIKSISTSLIGDEHYEEYHHIRHAEDLIQSVRYFKHSNYVLFTDETLYNYTVNTGSVTQTIRYENYKVDTTVRQMVWDFLLKEQVWTEEDFYKYSLNQINLIKAQINIICRLETTSKNKIDLLKQVRHNDYFRMILSYPSSDALIKMLKREKYKTILIFRKVYNLLSKIKTRL